MASYRRAPRPTWSAIVTGIPNVLKDASTPLSSLTRRYGDLLQALPDAMLVMNEGGNVVLMNAQAERQ